MLTTPADIAAAAQLACLLEASAPKPGNVSPGRHFEDLRYEDFLASASAIGAPLARAGDRALGVTILDAIQSTARWTRTNSNLGIVLLLAPLARAAIGGPNRLRETLIDVLAATTVDDARNVYAAIRLASPGGLGDAESQDVAGEPEVPLLETMKLASGWDGIAREYATGFTTTFDTAVPMLVRARSEGLSWSDAVVETFLGLLAAAPDTHIARRSGLDRAREVTAGAVRVAEAGGVRTVEGRLAIQSMDEDLRDSTHSANPGTTADLIAAAIFVVLVQDGWKAADRIRS